jgi:hypothetical protein
MVRDPTLRREREQKEVTRRVVSEEEFQPKEIITF